MSGVEAYPTQPECVASEKSSLLMDHRMTYQAAPRAASILHEPGPRYVTPLARLGTTPKDVDCPYCRKVVTTAVREVEAEDSGMMMCLMCLICWPMMFCYQPEKHINHHCSKCHRQLTHKTPNGQTVVVANPQAMGPALVASAFEHNAEMQQTHASAPSAFSDGKVKKIGVV